MANGYVHSPQQTSLLASHTNANLPYNSWSIIIGLVSVVIASLVAWFFAPKGENQTSGTMRKIVVRFASQQARCGENGRR
ncbi:hypothetical protein MMC16_003921 [Acarospora aff. strigata]|nr:hypothetical protein [Acarospora aff. strigata]